MDSGEIVHGLGRIRKIKKMNWKKKKKRKENILRLFKLVKRK